MSFTRNSTNGISGAVIYNESNQTKAAENSIISISRNGAGEDGSSVLIDEIHSESRGNIYGGVIYARYGKLYINENEGDVIFRNNTAHAVDKKNVQGGAIHAATQSVIGIEGNEGDVRFVGNKALSDNLYAYGGAIYTGGATLSLSGNSGVLEFSDNSVTGVKTYGGAIYSTTAEIIIDSNGSVRISGNSAGNNGSKDYDVMGGAIYAEDALSITNNAGGVEVCGNSVTAEHVAASSKVLGGAVYSKASGVTALTVTGNGNVDFHDNYIRLKDRVSFNSLYLKPTKASTSDTPIMRLAAGEGTSITFRDSVMLVPSSAKYAQVVSLNEDYTNAAGETVSATGSIVFTGSDAAGNDMRTRLALLKEKLGMGEVTEAEINDSLTSTLNARLELHNGSLRLEDGVVLNTTGGTVVDSGASVVLRHATLAAEGADVVIKQGAVLQSDAASVVRADSLVLEDGSTLRFDLSGYTGAPMLTLEGAFNLMGNTTVEFLGINEGEYGLWKVFALDPKQSIGQDLVNISYGETNRQWFYRDSTLTLAVWDDKELVVDADNNATLEGEFARATIGGSASYTSVHIGSGIHSLAGAGQLNVQDTLIVESGSTLLLNVAAAVGNIEVRQGGTLDILGTLTLADGGSLRVAADAEIRFSDLSLLSKIVPENDRAALHYTKYFGSPILRFSGSNAEGGAPNFDADRNALVTAYSGGGYRGSITVLSGTTLRNEQASWSDKAFGATYDEFSARNITVQGGGVLDINGRESYYRVVLEEGALLMNNAGSIAPNTRNLPVIDLLGDAEIQTGAHTSVVGDKYTATYLNLNNHTLLKTGADVLHLRHTTIGSGTVNVAEGTLELAQDTIIGEGRVYMGGSGRVLLSSHIGGSGTLVKNGAGVLEFASGSYGASLEAQSGHLLLNGHLQLGENSLFAVAPGSSVELAETVRLRDLQQVGTAVYLDASGGLSEKSGFKSADFQLISGGNLTNDFYLQYRGDSFMVHADGGLLSAVDYSIWHHLVGAKSVEEVCADFGNSDTVDTISIGSGATLYADDSVPANNFSLSGSGVFVLQPGSSSWNSNLSLSETWAGTIRLENASVVDFNANAFSTSNSAIQFIGVSGYLSHKTDEPINTRVILGHETGDSVDGLIFTDSYTKRTLKFTQAVSGTGNMVNQINNTGTEPQKINAAFSGDISGWTGAYIQNSSPDNVLSKLTFSGSATEVNAAIIKNTGYISLCVNNSGKTTTFNRDVHADYLEAKSGSVIGLGSGVVLTLDGVGTLADNRSSTELLAGLQMADGALLRNLGSTVTISGNIEVGPESSAGITGTGTTTLNRVTKTGTGTLSLSGGLAGSMTAGAGIVEIVHGAFVEEGNTLSLASVNKGGTVYAAEGAVVRNAGTIDLSGLYVGVGGSSIKGDVEYGDYTRQYVSLINSIQGGAVTLHNAAFTIQLGTNKVTAPTDVRFTAAYSNGGDLRVANWKNTTTWTVAEGGSLDVKGELWVDHRQDLVINGGTVSALSMKLGNSEDSGYNGAHVRLLDGNLKTGTVTAMKIGADNRRNEITMMGGSLEFTDDKAVAVDTDGSVTVQLLGGTLKSNSSDWTLTGSDAVLLTLGGVNIEAASGRQVTLDGSYKLAGTLNLTGASDAVFRMSGAADIVLPLTALERAEGAVYTVNGEKADNGFYSGNYYLVKNTSGAAVKTEGLTVSLGGSTVTHSLDAAGNLIFSHANTDTFYVNTGTVYLGGSSATSGTADAGVFNVAKDAVLQLDALPDARTMHELLSTGVSGSGTLVLNVSGLDTGFTKDGVTTYNLTAGFAGTLELAQGVTFTLGNKSASADTTELDISSLSGLVLNDGAILQYNGNGNTRISNLRVADNASSYIHYKASKSAHAVEFAGDTTLDGNLTITSDYDGGLNIANIVGDGSLAIQSGKQKFLATLNSLQEFNGALSFSGSDLNAVVHTGAAAAVKLRQLESSSAGFVGYIEADTTISKINVSAGSLRLSAGTTLTLGDTETAANTEHAIAALSMSDGSCLSAEFKKKDNSVFLGEVSLSGLATIETKQHITANWNAAFQIKKLIGSGNEDTLVLQNGSATDLNTTFEVGSEDNSGATSSFSGDVLLKINSGNNLANRAIVLNIMDSTVLKDSVVRLASNTAANFSYMGIGVNTDTTLAGIQDDTADTSQYVSIVAGKINSKLTQQEGHTGTAEKPVTLTLNVGAGESYTTAALLKTKVNLVKAGAGSQTFSGNTSQFDGTLTVNAGRLALTGSGDMGTGLISVAEAAQLELANAGAELRTFENTLDVKGTLRIAGGGVALSGKADIGTLSLANGAELAFVGSGVQQRVETLTQDGGAASVSGSADDLLIQSLRMTAGSVLSASADNLTVGEGGVSLSRKSVLNITDGAFTVQGDTDIAVNSAVNINGGTLNLQGALTGLGSVNISSGTLEIGGAVSSGMSFSVLGNGNLVLNSGVELEASRFALNSGGTGKLTLYGDGTLILGSAALTGVASRSDFAFAEPTDDSAADYWRGTIRREGVVGVDNGNKIVYEDLISSYGHAGSSVELVNCEGYAGANSGAMIVSNLVLTASYAADGTEQAAFRIKDGYSKGDTETFVMNTFAGSVSGDGKIVSDRVLSSNYTGLAFTGDVSGWTGAFELQNTKDTFNLRFAGNADTINIDVLKNQYISSKLNLYLAANKDMKLNGKVQADNIYVQYSPEVTFGETVSARALHADSAVVNLEEAVELTLGTRSSGEVSDIARLSAAQAMIALTGGAQLNLGVDGTETTSTLMAIIGSGEGNSLNLKEKTTLELGGDAVPTYSDVATLKAAGAKLVLRDAATLSLGYGSGAAHASVIGNLSGSSDSHLFIYGGENEAATHEVSIHSMEGMSGTVHVSGGDGGATLTLGNDATFGTGFASAHIEVQDGAALKLDGNNNNSASADNAQKVGKITLHDATSLEWTDGSYLLVEGVHLADSAEATLINTWNKNQYIAGLYGADATLNIRTQNQTDDGNRGMRYVVLTEAGDFSGAINLRNGENAAPYERGLLVNAQPDTAQPDTALAETVVNFGSSSEGYGSVLGFTASTSNPAEQLRSGVVAGLSGAMGRVYADTLTIDSSERNSYTYSGELMTNRIVKTGVGTQRLDGNLSEYNGLFEVQAGTLEIGGGRLNGGSYVASGAELVLDGVFSINSSSYTAFEAETQYSDGEHGFRSGSAVYELISGDGALRITDKFSWLVDGNSENGSVDTETGRLRVDYIGQSQDYWVNSGTPAYYSAFKDKTNDEGETLNSILVKGGSLVLDCNTADGVSIQVLENSSIYLDKEVVLDSSDVSLNPGKKAELRGSGTLVLGQREEAWASFTLSDADADEAWTGTVRLSGSYTSLSPEDYANSVSTVELCGVAGYMTKADDSDGEEYSVNLSLCNGDGGYAFDMNDGYDKDKRIFTGTVSGSGLWKRSSLKGTEQTIRFEGDTSGWNGVFSHEPNEAQNDKKTVKTNLVFTGTSELNAELQTNGKGELNVVLDDARLADGTAVNVNAGVKAYSLVLGTETDTEETRAAVNLKSAVDIAAGGVTNYADTTVASGASLSAVSFTNHATLSAGGVSLSSADGTAASAMQNVLVTDKGVTGSAGAATPGSMENTILHMQSETSFSLENMVLENVTVTADDLDASLALRRVQGEIELQSGTAMLHLEAAASDESADASVGQIRYEASMTNLSKSEGAHLVLMTDKSGIDFSRYGMYNVSVTLEGLSANLSSAGSLSELHAANIYLGGWLDKMLQNQVNPYAAVSLALSDEELSSALAAPSVSYVYTGDANTAGSLTIEIIGLAVPEPASAALSLAALAALAARRRRRY